MATAHSPNFAVKEPSNGFTAVNERPSPPSASSRPPLDNSPIQQRESWSHSSHDSPITLNGDKMMSPQSGLAIKRRYGEIDPGSDDHSLTIGTSSIDGRNSAYPPTEGDLDPRLAHHGAPRDWPSEDARLQQMLQADIARPEDSPYPPGIRPDMPSMNGGDMNGTMVTPKTGLPYDRTKRKRAFTNRTKTGCTTCRRRKKKCDEAKPQCNNCVRGGFSCGGYQQRREMSDNKLVPQKHFNPVAIQARADYWGDNSRTMRDSMSGLDRPYGLNENSAPAPVDYWARPPVNGGMRSLGGGDSRSLPPPLSSPHGSTHAPSSRPYAGLGNGYSTPTTYAPVHIAKNALHESQKLTQPTPSMSNNEETALDAMITKNPYKEGDEALVELRKRAATACERYNNLSFQGLGPEELLRNLRNVIDYDPLKPNDTVNFSQASDRIGEHVRISAPFYAEYGFNMRIGSRVTIKAGCRFEDTSNISIGDDTTIGPNVLISGEMHYSDPRWRPWRRGVDVRIGSNVYIGAGVIIAPEDTRMDHGPREIIIPDGCYIAPGAVINSPQQIPATERHISAHPTHNGSYGR